MTVECGNNQIFQLMVIGMLLLTVWSCASQPPPAPCTSTQCLISKGEAPKWINEPQAFSENPEMVYGIGTASAIPNKSLLRRAAQEKAKNEIASLIKTSVKSSFANSARAASGLANVSREESAVKEALESLVDAELVGTKIMAVWVNEYSSEAFALAGLNKYLACENIVSGLKKNHSIQDERADAMRKNCLRS